MTSAVTVEQLIALFVNIIDSTIKDTKLAAVMTTLAQPLATLAVAEGEEVALTVLNGIATPNAYASWEKLISSATPETRIALLESGRQLTITATINKIKSEQALWDMLMLAFKLALTLIPMVI